MANGAVLARKISSVKKKAKRDLRRAREKASRKTGSVTSKAGNDLSRASEAATRKKRELAKRAQQDVNRAELAARRKATDLRQGSSESRGIGGRLADAGQSLATGGPDGAGSALSTEERRMVAGAEQSAMMGAPIQDATLAPLSAPQQTEFLTHSGRGMAVDSLVVGGSGDGRDSEPEPMFQFGQGGDDPDGGRDGGDDLTFDDAVLFGGDSDDGPGGLL
jgi:hypothetical protein